MTHVGYPQTTQTSYSPVKEIGHGRIGRWERRRATQGHVRYNHPSSARTTFSQLKAYIDLAR